MQHKLASVAARQGGAFTVHQALAGGYSRDSIRHRVESGRWSRPARGILTTGDPAAGGGADDLVRDAWVAVLSHPGAVVGHGVAAELHGIDTYRSVPGLELVRPVGPLRTPAYDGVKLTTAALPAGHLGEPRGVPATSLARTAADLARRGSLRDGVVVLDSAMRLGCSRSELVAVVAACHGWPGSRSLRTALAVADEGAESPLESLAHVLHHEHGLPRAVTQVAMFDEAGFIGRVDDYWPGVATVGESDGLAKYDERGSLRREKLRQERLERAGLQVVRVTYADVTRNAEVTARRYREAFERGSQRLAWRPLDLHTVASPGERGRRAG